MADWVTQFLKFVRPALATYLALALVGIVLLVLPDDLGDGSSFRLFRAQYWPYILICALFFGTLSACVAAGNYWRHVEYEIGSRASRYRWRQRFNALTLSEKVILVWCLENYTETFRAPRTWKAIQSLSDKGFVWHQNTDARDLHWFKIRDTIWRRLQEFRAQARATLPDDDKEAKQAWQIVVAASRGQNLLER